jgi:hypothetical protein
MRISPKLLNPPKRIQPWDKLVAPKPVKLHPLINNKQHVGTGDEWTHLRRNLQHRDVWNELFQEADKAALQERKYSISNSIKLVTEFCKLHAFGSKENTADIDGKIKLRHFKEVLELEVNSKKYRNLIRGVDFNTIPEKLRKSLTKLKRKYDQKMKMDNISFWKSAGGKDPAKVFVTHKHMDKNQLVEGIGNFGQVMKAMIPPRYLPFRPVGSMIVFEPGPIESIKSEEIVARLDADVNEFDLSSYERECLKEILGARCKGDQFAITCREFATIFENKDECIRMLRKAIQQAIVMAQTFGPGEQNLQTK